MRAGDAAEFDPYYKWLGIPTSEQPPNHYRLLGIELFEEDPEVITAAADRQMGHVKAFATGPYAAHSQLLLNELSKARVCLLNANLKPIYDQQLTKIRSERLKAIAASTQRILPTEPQQKSHQVREEFAPRTSGPIAIDAATFPTATQFRRKHRRTSSLPLTFFALLIFAPTIAGLLWYAKMTAPVTPPLAAVAPDTPNVAPSAPVEAQPEREEPATEAKPERNNHPAPNRRPRQPRKRLPIAPGPDAQRLPLLKLPNQEPRAKSNFGQGLPMGESFASLPRFVAISDISAERPIIGTIEPPVERLATLEVHLIAPNYLERANRVILLHRHRDTDEDVRWLVFDESTPIAREITTTGDPGNATPIAMVRATKHDLSFAWLDEAGREVSAERLQNCILRLTDGQRTHHMQLRAPLEEGPPVALGNWDEVYEFQLPLDSMPALPPANELKLRLNVEDGFPLTRVVTGQPDRLAADEQLLLSFGSTDYAGLGVYWEQKGKVLTVHVSPGFRLVSYPNDLFILSRDEVDRIEKRLERDKREAAKEYARRVRRRSALNRNLTAANQINIQLPGGGTTVQLRNQKQAAVAAAQAAVNANEARINALGRLAPEIEQDESNRIPTLRSLATDLEGRAKVGFELYMPVGSEEIVLFRKGMPNLQPINTRIGL